MAKEFTLVIKCECGESTTTKDYHEIAEKCEKCGKQTQVSNVNKPRAWEGK
jgi:translation initiation factor 2 beta subunit (eIF-2beta)/eIF-5